ncbi:MAG: 30S ribosomal protein S20 [Candidatus Magasanikbacteria bacterium]|nr:30S ribosomal protein S20 [Candidatus Magasanikbacteria bacterium]
MPNKDNAKKALRQSIKRALRNKKVKIAYKEAVKNVDKAILAGSKDLTALVVKAQKKLDKAAKLNVISKNTAGRKVARLMRKMSKVKVAK